MACRTSPGRSLRWLLGGSDTRPPRHAMHREGVELRDELVAQPEHAAVEWFFAAELAMQFHEPARGIEIALRCRRDYPSESAAGMYLVHGLVELGMPRVAVAWGEDLLRTSPGDGKLQAMLDRVRAWVPTDSPAPGDAQPADATAPRGK